MNGKNSGELTNKRLLTAVREFDFRSDWQIILRFAARNFWIYAVAAGGFFIYQQTPSFSLALYLIVVVFALAGFELYMTALLWIHYRPAMYLKRITLKRNGRERTLPLHELAVGDKVEFDEGEIVPFDIKTKAGLIKQGTKLQYRTEGVIVLGDAGPRNRAMRDWLIQLTVVTVSTLILTIDRANIGSILLVAGGSGFGLAYVQLSRRVKYYQDRKDAICRGYDISSSGAEDDGTIIIHENTLNTLSNPSASIKYLNSVASKVMVIANTDDPRQAEQLAAKLDLAGRIYHAASPKSFRVAVVYGVDEEFYHHFPNAMYVSGTQVPHPGRFSILTSQDTLSSKHQAAGILHSAESVADAIVKLRSIASDTHLYNGLAVSLIG